MRARWGVAVLLASVAALALAAGAVATPLGEIIEFPLSPGVNSPNDIAAGAEGNLWFTEGVTSKVGRITPSGAITELTTGISAGSNPVGIARGPEGDLWFTEFNGARIGRMTPSGVVTEFSSGLTPGSEPWWIVEGPDGNMWFTERVGDRIGRITPAGEITEFTKGITPGSGVYAIAAGPDGNLWFTETSGKIGRITVSGEVHEFSDPSLAGTFPTEIAEGPDKQMWFTEGTAGALGKINPASGEVVPAGVFAPGSVPESLSTGPDDNMWVTESEGNRIASVTAGGKVTEYTVPTAKSRPFGIATGPDGSMWFTEEHGDAIGRIGTGAPPALAAPVTIGGGGVAGSPQTCNASWSAWAREEPSGSLFGFDGYRWLLDGSPVATGQAYGPPAAAIGHALSCSDTVTYPLLAVTTSATSAPETVLAPTSSPAPLPAPVVGALTQSSAAWREGKALARISSSGRRAPVGTTFSFTLNEQATVTLSFGEQLRGRRHGHRCVAPSRSNARSAPCTRTVPSGALTLPAHPGRDRVLFQGRLSAHRRLAPGRYRLSLLATNAAGARSAPRTLAFRIVR